MRLSDVVGASDLAIFAQVGLVLFCFAFVGVLIYTFTRRNREIFDRVRRLPLEEDGPKAAEPSSPGSEAKPERTR